ncbi:TPA: DUF4058 family protein [Candidatus Poribacteria bacterium]|nr:DUF4058 family protein [Candidatus Poribacteria bacterium]
MPSPFPGMDPYLEGRNIWPDVHSALIVAIRDVLAPQVAPAYYVAIEERTYIIEEEMEGFVGRPDAAIIAVPSNAESYGGRRKEQQSPTFIAQTVNLPLFEKVREGYLEIHDARTHAVVTVIEVLSPSNKAPGAERDEYESKRRQVLATLTNLVEIDLLRAGEPMEMQPLLKSDYRILVRAGWERPRARLYAFSVRQPIPDLPVPLRYGEKEAVLAVGKLLSEIYDRARYDIRLNYRQPPEILLSSEDSAWADELLRAKGVPGTDAP